MSNETYRETNFRPDSLARIVRINEILSEYDQKLTARQVYYQFVSRGWLENTERSYKGLTSLLTDARYAGLVDWEAIEDRGREPAIPLEFRDLAHRVESAIENYRLDRWEGQENYVELWVEKQALAGVLAPLARKFHVTLMVNKGYSSASAMKDAAERIRFAYNDAVDAGQAKMPIILYLGDHDPSGEDMVRDIEDRLNEFLAGDTVEVEVRELALTMAQIRKFNPPPNPAKVTDSRAAAYIAKYGPQSWELDALPPRELNRIVERAFAGVLDLDKYNAVIKREEADKAKLRKAAGGVK